MTFQIKSYLFSIVSWTKLLKFNMKKLNISSSLLFMKYFILLKP